MVPTLPGAPALNGHTDTVPDVVGRLGSPISLAIFTEGNHFPALLGGEIIEPFRIWAKSQPQYAPLGLDNIVIVTLPQPMIVGMILEGGVSFGNLTLEVSRASGFYPDIVMGGPGRWCGCARLLSWRQKRASLRGTAGPHYWSRPAIRSAFKASRILPAPAFVWSWRAKPSRAHAVSTSTH